MKKDKTPLSEITALEVPELLDLISHYAALEEKNRERILRIIKIYLSEQKERSRS